MKKFFFALFLVSLGCLFAALISEIALRLIGFKDLSAFPVKYHEVLGTIFRDDISNIEVNRHGFLTSEFPKDLSDDKSRVVIVGDSFTATKYLPKAKRFGEQFANAFGVSNSQVFNLGVDGYGTNNCLLAWSEYGLNLKPKVSIYNFYINDIRDNLTLSTKFTVNEDGIKSHFGKQGWLRSAATSARRVSALANYLYTLVRKWYYSYRLKEKSNKIAPSLDVTNYTQVEKYLYSNLQANALEKEWALMELRLKWWVEANRKVGAVPIVVYIPPKDQVDINHRYVDLASSYPVSGAVQAKLKRICSSVGCLFFDMTESFIEAEKSGRQLYYYNDPHWNSKGVEFGAKLIADYVSKNVIGILE